MKKIITLLPLPRLVVQSKRGELATEMREIHKKILILLHHFPRVSPTHVLLDWGREALNPSLTLFGGSASLLIRRNQKTIPDLSVNFRRIDKKNFSKKEKNPVLHLFWCCLLASSLYFCLVTEVKLDWTVEMKKEIYQSVFFWFMMNYKYFRARKSRFNFFRLSSWGFFFFDFELPSNFITFWTVNNKGLKINFFIYEQMIYVSHSH